MTVSEGETVPRVIVLLSERWTTSSHKHWHCGPLLQKFSFLTYNASPKKGFFFWSESFLDAQQQNKLLGNMLIARRVCVFLKLWWHFMVYIHGRLDWICGAGSYCPSRAEYFWNIYPPELQIKPFLSVQMNLECIIYFKFQTLF